MTTIKTTIQRILGGIACCLSVALPVAVSSCTEDDGDAAGSEPRVAVLYVAPGVEGDLNATRLNTDDNARDGEFINTLCVYMVDAGGIVEMVIKPDFTDPAMDEAVRDSAAKGNLDEYTSDEFMVFPGRRSFYAFANWGDTEMAQVVNYKVGDSFDRAFVDSLVLNDPASAVNPSAADPAERRYIPMSGMLEEEDIYAYLSADNTIRIPLERLVSRLRLTLLANDELSADIPIKSIVVGGFADRVTLFPEATADVSQFGYGQSFTYAPEAGEADFSAQLGHSPFADVYVNETRRGESFEVTMTTSQYDSEVVYNGFTSRKELPRNSIFPLNIRLLSMEPVLKAELIAPPIGVVMKPIEAKFDGNTFTFTMYEGATFTITPTMPGATTTVSYVWEIDSSRHDIKASAGADGVLTGTLSAIPEMELELGLQAKWTAKVGQQEQQYIRNYNVIIKTVDISDMVLAPAATAAPRLLPHETMYLWRK